MGGGGGGTAGGASVGGGGPAGVGQDAGGPPSAEGGLAGSVADPQLADVDLRVAQSVDRHELYAMQTPQIFERKILEQAYQVVSEKMLLVTDEVSAVELIGRKAALVVHDEFNFKITYPRDLSLAGFILRQRGV